MDTRFLESLLATIESGSVAGAARRLNLTPAAVTQRIHAIEVEIGATLLTRSGRTMQPTEAGAAVAANLRSLLQQVRDLQSIAGGDVATGVLRLGAISTVVTGLMPAILRQLIEERPRIEIYMAPGVSEQLYQRVVEGDLDAAFIVQPPFALPKSCAWRTLREEPLVLIAPAGTKYTDTPSMLHAHPFIRYDRSDWGGRIIENYLKDAGIRPNERFELDALDAIAVMVGNGLGVSIVPDWAPPWPANVVVRKIPLDASRFTRRLGVVWRRSSVRTSLIQSLIDKAAAAADTV